jgi:hypothetical protein
MSLLGRIARPSVRQHAMLWTRCMQVKDVNAEMRSSCGALKARVDELAESQAIVTRSVPAALAATTAAPAAAAPAATAAVAPIESLQQAAASQIVDESVAEAAALVQDLFDRQRPATSAPAATPPPSGASEVKAAPPGSPPGTPRRLAVFVDDETLVQMSTKLTAMFIAIQRCGPHKPPPPSTLLGCFAACSTNLRNAIPLFPNSLFPARSLFFFKRTPGSGMYAMRQRAVLITAMTITAQVCGVGAGRQDGPARSHSPGHGAQACKRSEWRGVSTHHAEHRPPLTPPRRKLTRRTLRSKTLQLDGCETGQLKWVLTV